MSPRISVAILVRSKADTLAQAVASVLDQDHPATEILVAEARGSDPAATRRALEGFGERVAYLPGPDAAAGAAMNGALARASGDLLAWLDHEDAFLPGKLGRQAALFASLGDPGAVLHSDVRLIDGAGASLGEIRLPLGPGEPGPSAMALAGVVNRSTLLLPVALLREAGGFGEAAHHAVDTELLLRLGRGGRLVHLPEVLTAFRVGTGEAGAGGGAVAESDAVWLEALDRTGPRDWSGEGASRLRFHADMEARLRLAGLGRAAGRARARAETAVADTLVSVIIPAGPDGEATARSARSVLAQTHRRIELLIVGDGARGPLPGLDPGEPRLRLLPSDGVAAGAARNRAMAQAQGEYLAFLNPGDRYAPDRLARQMTRMQEEGRAVSFTAYWASFPEATDRLARVDAAPRGAADALGWFSATASTAMLHESVVRAGFAFPDDLRPAAEWCLWAELWVRHRALACPEPLAVVEWSAAGSPFEVATALDAALELLSRLDGELPPSARHRLKSLAALADRLETLHRHGRAGPEPPLLDEEAFERLFMPAGARNRVAARA